MDMQVKARFWAKVSYPHSLKDCWVWNAALDSGGYGMFTIPVGVHVRAHRVSYEMAKGAIPDGWTIDHLCRNRACVNPEHLEAVSRGENVRRGGPFRRQTHCKNGHLLMGNRARDGWCLTCSRAYYRARYAARK